MSKCINCDEPVEDHEMQHLGQTINVWLIDNPDKCDLYLSLEDRPVAWT